MGRLTALQLLGLMKIPLPPEPAIATLNRRTWLAGSGGLFLSAAAGCRAAAQSGLEIITDGLLLPEGPVPLNDGDVLVMEVLRGCIRRVRPNGQSLIVAETGGGPNGGAIGPDGRLYVCNNGGVIATPDTDGVLRTQGLSIPGGVGRIDRINLANGRVETVLTEIQGQPLRAPNDLVFDSSGGFWFTDMGKAHPTVQERGAVIYVAPDGQAVRIVAGLNGCNGIGLSPREDILYVSETFSGEVLAFDLAGPGQVRPAPGTAHGGRSIGRAGPGVHIDSLKVDGEGKVLVSSIGPGGFLTFAPTGEPPQFKALPDPLVTSLAFGGPDLRTVYATLAWTGRLARMHWPVAGKPPAFSA